MNTAIKGLMCSRAFANFYLFILHFISWRIFPCKKIAFAKILVRHLRLCSVEKKVSFFIHLKFLGCTNFFLEMVMLDWLGEGLKLFERKKGRMESNTWQFDCVFWGKCDGAALMEERKRGLWSSPCSGVPTGSIV